MRDIAKAVAGVGAVALGFWGYNTDIVGAGWMVLIGVIILLDFA